MKKRRKKHKSRRKLSCGVLVVVLILGFSILYSFQHPSNDNVGSSNKAAIVDHLSLSVPNQTFVDASITILKNAGYTVDYYKGEEVTVDFYRNLATHDYEFIFLRVHSANNRHDKGPIFLWTSEPYRKSKYIYEQLTDQIRSCVMLTEGSSRLFSVGPEFIRRSTKEKFQNTIIIAMGCESLKDTELAQAFIEKGASAFVGWSEDVIASHTDQATTNLLKHLITEKQTVKDAVTATMEEVGPDPQYKSWLLYYPVSEGT